MKKVAAVIKLQIPAGKATPAPPVGPALAPHGLNLGEFCQRFNDLTQNQLGWTIPVEVKVFEDRTYELKLKKPPVSDYLKKAAGIEKGSGEPNRKKVAKISQKQLREIAEKKIADLNCDTIEAAVKIIEGSAKSMGLEIVP